LRTPGKNCRVYLRINVDDKDLVAAFTGSRGLAEFIIAESTEELLRRADIALYVAKRTGKIGLYLLKSQRVCGKP
jgi:PleD family two-component response regulator